MTTLVGTPAAHTPAGHAAAISLHENTLALLDRACALIHDGRALEAFWLLTPPPSAL